MSTFPSTAFSGLLRTYRRRANLTQEALAAHAGISARSVSDLERGISRVPYPATVDLLVKALGLTGQDRAAFLAAAHAARPQEAPALRVPPLPTPLTTLISREREEAAVVHLLQQEHIRLLTLTGPAGVGKTRLALQVATTLRPTFANGAVLISLAPLSEPELVIPTIAQALGLRNGNGQDALQTLITVLRDQELLLVLDNFEHLLGAANYLIEVLSACPRLKFLTTSRARLHVRGEQTFSVPPLSVPDLDHLPALSDDLENYGAIVLFLQRVCALTPNFQLTPALAPIVAEICVRLDGLPLAIELAAARSKLLPLPVLLARLAERSGPTALPLLTRGPQDAPPHHWTLHAAIGWSYDLLHEDEQRLFRSLCFFVGGASLDAIEAVCIPEADYDMRLLDRLESLLDHHLIYQNDERAAWFDLLETIREYGLERLEASGEKEACARRHATYYLALAETAEPELTGPKQQKWHARLIREQGNLRAALRWLLESGALDLGLRLSGALWGFWKRSGQVNEGRAWLRQFLDAAPKTDVLGAAGRAKALHGAGTLACEQGDYSAATALLQESLMLKRNLGDQAGIASTLNNLAIVAEAQGNLISAQALYEESLATCRETGDRRIIGALLNNLSNIQAQLGNDDAASLLLKESEKAFRDAGSLDSLAWASHNRGYIHMRRGEYVQALQLFEESLMVFQELENQWMKAVALQSLGNVTRKLGDFAQAESYYIQGIRLHQQAGRFMELVECLEGLAGTYLDQGHLGEAACLYGGAAQWREQTGTRVADSERRASECDLAQLRTALGEQNFLLAWRKGQTTPIDKIFVHLTQEMGAAKGEAHYYTKRMQQPHCPRCQQDQYVIKSGFNHTGSQRYRCQHCCHYFTPAPKPEGYDLPLRTRALQLYLEGTSFRAIGRLLGLHHQTVSNWVMQAATALPASVTDQTPTATIELDKLYTLVQQKKTRST